MRRGLVRSNAVALVDRPKEPRRRWRILSPQEVGAVERALDDLIASAETDKERDDRQIVLILFLTLIGTGVRRGEALGLRWRSVHLADPDGPFLRVEETWVRHAADTPKSAAGQRTIALGSRLAEELFEHRARSAFDGDDELVFGKPPHGKAVRRRHPRQRDPALLERGRDSRVRPALPRPAAQLDHERGRSRTPPEALMTRAGHSSYATTRRYVDLAGERFREEADRLERRLWGESGTKKRYQVGGASVEETTDEAVTALG